MKLINKLNSDPIQRAYITGNPGQRIIMDIRFMPRMSLWVADFTLDDFSLKGITLLTSPNVLRSYKNIIPFGIACLTDDAEDPRNLNDFESGYASLYLLTQEEVEAIEVEYFE